MFVRVPFAGIVTMTVKFVVARFVKVVRVGHVTTPVVKIPPADALTNVTPVGNVSRTMTLVEMDGPRFVTVSV